MMFPKKFVDFYKFKTKRSANTYESWQQDLIDREIETEVEAFLAEEVKEAEVLFWWNSNKKKYTHLSRFARRHLSAPESYVYCERLI